MVSQQVKNYDCRIYLTNIRSAKILFNLHAGMTETSPVTFQGFASDSLAVRTGTIGFPANHVEVVPFSFQLFCFTFRTFLNGSKVGSQMR